MLDFDASRERKAMAAHLLPLDLRVIYMDLSGLFEKIAANEGGSSLAGVSSVLLKSKAVDGNLLARHSVHHGSDHLLAEAPLLVFVHFDDLIPVLGNFVKAVGLTQVDKIENILLEARSAEADG